MPKSENEVGMLGSPFAAGLLLANPAAVQAWIDINAELAQIVAERWQHDAEAQRAIMACKSPLELAQVLPQQWDRTTRHCAEAITRLTRIVTDSTEKTLQGAVTGRARAYDDVPL